MKISKSLLFVFFSLIAMTSLSFVNANTEYNDDNYDTSIQSWMNQYDIPGVGVSIIEGGVIEYSKTFGYANLEENTQLTNQSILRTESISKSITAYLTMILVEEGLLDLHASIHEYIDIDLPEEITIHQLLTHQAGLDIGPFSQHFHPHDIKPSLYEHLNNTIRLVGEPGTFFSYSNVGYNTLQYIIETVTGLTFNECVEQYIFQPFSIEGASFEYQPSLASLYAMGYDINGNEVEPYVYPGQASGGMFTNLDAITTLFQKIYTNDLILSENGSSKLYQIYTKASKEYSLVSDGYGYGHFIESNDSKAVFHGGQGHGWMAFFYAYPEEQSAIIIITNSQRSYPMISDLIQQFSYEMNKDQPGMAMIVDAIFYVNILIVFIGLIFLAILVKTYRKTRKKPKNIKSIHYFMLIVFFVLLIINIYLWVANYMFIQVLYPIHFEIFRWILTVFMIFFVLIHTAPLLMELKFNKKNDD